MPSPTRPFEPDEAEPDILDAPFDPAPVPARPARRLAASTLPDNSRASQDSRVSDRGAFNDEAGGSVRRRLTGNIGAGNSSAGNSGPLDNYPPAGPPPRPARKARASGNANPASNHTNPARKSGAARAAMLPPPTRHPPSALGYEVAGVLLVALGALLSFYALHPVEGILTRWGVEALRFTTGVGAVIIPLGCATLGVLLIARRHTLNLRAFGRGATVALLVLLTAMHLGVPPGQERDPAFFAAHGGCVGGALAWALRSAIGEAGAIIALIAFSLVSLLFFTEISLGDLAGRLGRALRRGGRHVRRGVRAGIVAPLRQRRQPPFDQFDGPLTDELYEPPTTPRRRMRALPDEILRDVHEAHRPNALGQGAAREALPPAPADPARSSERSSEKSRRSRFIPVDELLGEESLVAPRPPVPQVPAAAGAALHDAPRIEIVDTPPPPSVVDAVVGAAGAAASVVSNAPSDEMLTPLEALEAQAQATAGTAQPVKRLRPPGVRRRFGGGPPMPEYFDDAVRALDAPVPPDLGGAQDDIHQGVISVTETLAAFKIDAKVTDVKRGPVITRYEVQPAPGVRVAAIANLDRDIARSLSAIAVRIEAPVPGKNVVGIEVPNKRVHLVRVRDVLELPEFLGTPSKLAFVLGKDIAGQPKWADLAKMPHLLIAGATNSGKSVCLNSIIASILVRATPDEVKFSLIDPKRVELTLFKGIKHLYHPVVVEPKDAVRALRGAIVEMDRRYKRFAERGVRNITSYNSKLEEGEAPLPYIVIVIDELADLMMTAAAEFERLICRLAQLARATGIHLIVATQRPSVNVITGVIKANIPARIAFAVASQVDSRTILDCVGADRLIGSGDMLFDSNNGGKATRIQGSYLSEEEVNRVVEVIKNHYALDDAPLAYGLDLDAIEADAPGESNDLGIEEKRDELYDEIREFVLRHQEMSASLIQRKFEIGYPRAGRIVDQLERDGILGPADGPKPRKVIGNGR